MVQVECFKFELVDATTKISFKEHTKEGKTYVEVEPGAEYFISMHKIAKTETDVLITYSIDAGIDNLAAFVKNYISHEPFYTGIQSRAGGIVTQTSLVFAKPTICHKPSGSTSNLLMGNVEIKIYEKINLDGTFVAPRDIVSTFTAASAKLHEDGTSKKKCLRSDKGSAVITSTRASTVQQNWKRGNHLDTSKCVYEHFLFHRQDSRERNVALTPYLISLLAVTLNYCAALGLMEVGVLKKPSEWEHHRMKYPALPGSNPFAVQGNVTGNVIDISKLDYDDDED
jgi:hypothetical protein